MLGVAKSISAIISGEMKDTAMLSDTLNYLRSIVVFNNEDVQGMMQSFRSVASMLPKGGTKIWGDSHGAADDVDFGQCTRPSADAPKRTYSSHGAFLAINDHNETSYLNINQTMGFMRKLFPDYMKMIDGTYSLGVAGPNDDLTSEKYDDPLYWVSRSLSTCTIRILLLTNDVR